MLPSYLLSLREDLEAALIIGIVIGALHQIKRPDLKPTIWAGVISAVIVSIGAASLLTILGAEFEGRAEEIFEGIAMLIAAAVVPQYIHGSGADIDH